MAAPVPNPQPYPEIPDKLYFRIGEVSQLAGVKPYVLRYWETEFAGIGPKKSGSNHRLYRRKDVELILDIKHLLYEKRYTIEGARKFLMGEGRAAARAEMRGLAKPVQAVAAVPAPVAVAVGAAASPMGSPASVPLVAGVGAGVGLSTGASAGATSVGTTVGTTVGPVAAPAALVSVQGTGSSPVAVVAPAVVPAVAPAISGLHESMPQAGPRTSRSTPAVTPAAPVSSGSISAVAGAGLATPASGPSASGPFGSAVPPVSPARAELVGSIRKELLSLLDLLSH